MKPYLFLLIAVSLGLNIASVSPTKAQITANPTPPSQTQKGILQAQKPDIETLQQEASKYTQQGKPPFKRQRCFLLG